MAKQLATKGYYKTIWKGYSFIENFQLKGIVNAEELVRPCSHIDVIWLALRPFLVHESVNGVIRGGMLDKPIHDLEEGLRRFSEFFFDVCTLF